MSNIEHPDITRIEREGYVHQPTREIICSKCGTAIEECDWYGAFNGKAVCISCLRKKIDNMSDPDVIELLEYKPERAEY